MNLVRRPALAPTLPATMYFSPHLPSKHVLIRLLGSSHRTQSGLFSTVKLGWIRIGVESINS